MADHFHPSLAPRPAELVQLVGNYRGALPVGDWGAQEKIDGWRAAWFAGSDGRQRLWTRNGVPIEGVGHIAHRLRAMERVAGEQMMFDGEFLVDGTLTGTKAWCERGWKSGGEAGTLHLFDCMTQADWQQGGTARPWYDRQRDLLELIKATEGLSDDWEWREGTKGKEPPYPHVTPLSWEYVNDAADVLDMAYRIWARGGEGLVLKRLDCPYVRDRSPDWLKVKRSGER